MQAVSFFSPFGKHRCGSTSILVRAAMLLAFLCALGASAEAQFYNTGSDPFSTHWQQLRTDSVRLIYDSSTAEQMQWLAPYTHWLAANAGASLRHKPAHIDLIFHRNAALSNGVVTWAPKRAEIYPYASGDDDNQLWLRHVLLHEYRHAVQIDALNKGFSRALYYIFGEQVIGAISGVFVPRWFLEGDAVLTETLLTHGGRGRKAAFLQEMRTAVLAQKTPSYEQAFVGSYRWQLPDFYRMGYLITSASRLKYGSDIWADALERTARRPWTFVPFNASLRRTTGGKGKLRLYHESMDFWRDLWQRQDSTIQPTAFDILSRRRTDYESYLQPQRNARGVVAYKSSPNFVSKFVLIDKNGRERTLATPSDKNDFDFSLRGDTLLWSERRPHVRWENAQHNVLVMHDLQNGKTRKITSRSRISQPDISPSGKEIVAIEFNDDNTQSIVILDFSGAKIKEHKLGVDELVAWPHWISEQQIAAVFTSDKGKSIETLDVASGARNILLSPRYDDIRHLSVSGDSLYFTSDITGLDNIYALATCGGEPVRLTSAKYGAAWPTKFGNELFYSNLSPNGYDVAVRSSADLPTDEPFDPMCYVADTLALTEKQFAAEAANSFSTSSYSHLNLFKFHSWGPVVVDASAYNVKPGLSLTSQNLLNTCVFQASVDFDKDKTEVAELSFSYTGFYPRFSLVANYGFQDFEYKGYAVEEESNKRTLYRYMELDARQHYYKMRAEVALPLNFSSGAWQRQLQPKVAVELQKSSDYDYYTQLFEENRFGRWLHEKEWQTIKGQTFNNVVYNLSYTHLRRPAVRDIGSRLGFIVSARYRHSLGGIDVGNVVSGEATIYLPGLLRHQRIALIVKAQKKKLVYGENGTVYFLSDEIDRPRGYKSVTNQKLTLFRANYDTPLWNADLTLGPIVHVKRFALQAFYDHAIGTTVPLSGVRHVFTQRSAGATITAETYWLRLPFATTLGCRAAYLLDSKKLDAAFVFGISLK